MAVRARFGILISLLTLAGCSVLSERTDEQAWLEFKKDHSARSPASVSDPLAEQLEGIPFRKILMDCGASSSPRGCYQESVIRHFDEVYHQVRSGSPVAAEYRKAQSLFLSFHSYEKTMDEVLRFHQSLLSGVEWSAREHARELLRSCESVRSERVRIERFDLFSGGVTEMPKEVYSCLSQRWNEDLEDLLRDTSDRLGLRIESPTTRGWIMSHQLIPLYEGELTSALMARAEKEKAAFDREVESVLRGFDFKASDTELLQRWTPVLRARYPYSSVEQWILSWKNKSYSGRQ
jgi:hypothetical protein